MLPGDGRPSSSGRCFSKPHPRTLPRDNAKRGKLRLPAILGVLVVLLLTAPLANAADNGIVLCRIGETAPAAWPSLRAFFEGKGYQVAYYEGEATIERHVEKVSGLNRGPGRVFLAVELIPAARTHVLVAMTDAKKGEGRFLTVDEIPDRFSKESEKLARSVAGQFKVKVKHLPLFPLLGVSMPGIFVRMEFKEGEFEDGMNMIGTGVERYFNERTKQ